MDTKQELLLSTLIYIPAFYNGAYSNRTVAEILNSPDFTIPTNPPPCEMSPAEWKQVTDAALADEAIANMRVTDMYYDQDTQGACALFYDSDNYVAVFKGTGEGQWSYDVQEAVGLISVDEQKFLDWFKMETKIHPDVMFDAAGHSRGGYVSKLNTICHGDRIRACYAFDAQGFSAEKEAHFADGIARYQGKIFSYSLAGDFVTPLLHSITLPDHTFFIVDKTAPGDLAAHHKPNGLLVFDGTNYSLGAFGTQSPAMEMVNGFCYYLEDNCTYAERRVMFFVLGEFIENIFTNGDMSAFRKDVLNRYGVDIISKLAAELDAYLTYLRVYEPATYHRYMLGLVSYTGSDTIEEDLALSLGAINMLTGAVESSTIRDFCDSTLEKILEATSETITEDFWRVSSWRELDDLEQLGAPFYEVKTFNEADTYYHKLIDLNNASAKQVKDIFEKAKSLDSEYAAKIQEATDKLRSVSASLSALTAEISIPS